MKRFFYFLLLLFITPYTQAQKSFQIVPLGVYGGTLEGNMSSYLIAETTNNNYICFDAGTIGSGLAKAIEHKTFNEPISTILKENIKGYFITHGHLDHNSGLIINSPTDAKKPIYGFPFVIDIYKDHYFINDTWINFANEGQSPILNKYNYVYLEEGQKVKLENTNLSVTPFVLDHVKPYKSSAALIQNNTNEYVLYLSDTGADRIENSTQLKKLWQTIAPLIQKKQLKGILIEVSFPNKQPEHLLFGHLTPKLLQEELAVLATFTGKKALKNFPIIITHIKPEANNEKLIHQELQENNQLQLHYIFPQQGIKIEI